MFVEKKKKKEKSCLSMRVRPVTCKVYRHGHLDSSFLITRNIIIIHKTLKLCFPGKCGKYYIIYDLYTTIPTYLLRFKNPVLELFKIIATNSSKNKQ